MRIASALSIVALLAAPAAAWAQEDDTPVATANGQSLNAAADAPPAAPELARTPPASAARAPDPFAALNGVPRDRGMLSGFHGSAGVVIGSHDTRGAYATVNGPIGENSHFMLGFSTFSTDAYPYAYGYPYGYGGGTRTSLGAAFEWRPHNDRPPFAYDSYGADWPGYPSRYYGETTTDVTDGPG